MSSSSDYLNEDRVFPPTPYLFRYLTAPHPHYRSLHSFSLPCLPLLSPSHPSFPPSPHFLKNPHLSLLSPPFHLSPPLFESRPPSHIRPTAPPLPSTYPPLLPPPACTRPLLNNYHPPAPYNQPPVPLPTPPPQTSNPPTPLTLYPTPTLATNFHPPFLLPPFLTTSPFHLPPPLPSPILPHLSIPSPP